MSILNDPKYAVEAAALNDLIGFEGGELVTDTPTAAVVRLPSGLDKCLFADINAFREISPRGEVCLMNMPLDAPEALGFEAEPCVTHAYLKPMPPRLPRLDIRRLAPSLAETVAREYSYKGGGYTSDEVAAIMRDKGVFGAIVDGKLAGFIGRHDDGSMGMLKVFDVFRRRGIGEELESFMITYVMTFGRVPVCDVYADNLPSVRLQQKLGLTAANRYTFWTEL